MKLFKRKKQKTTNIQDIKSKPIIIDIYVNPVTTITYKIDELKGLNVAVNSDILIKAFDDIFGKGCYQDGLLDSNRALKYLYATNAHYAQPLNNLPSEEEQINALEDLVAFCAHMQ